MINPAAQLDEHISTIQGLRPLLGELEIIAGRMAESLAAGGKILWMGNGGSAADSQHLAAELVGRFRRERKGLASVALTTDSSILTAVGNDYGYERVFARQVEALCRPGDVVVGISTSGNSPNILQALDAAVDCEAITVGFAGGSGGKMSDVAEHCLIVPATSTARIQEAHILLGHIICDWIESSIIGG